MKENWQLIKWMRFCFYTVMVALIFSVSLEHLKAASATVVVPTEIPEESLRLRILAHSDTPQDQWVKQQVRDQVTALVSDWVREANTLAEARQILNQRLPELKDVVQQTVRDAGMTYGSQVEMGLIPFPTKLYGNRLYPAGDYEGLLITLGAGQGENWWCVLFPPLCFVDFGSGEALVDENESDAEDQNSSAQGQEEEQKEIEVRFFLVELFMKIKNYFI